MRLTRGGTAAGAQAALACLTVAGFTVAVCTVAACAPRPREARPVPAGVYASSGGEVVPNGAARVPAGGRVVRVALAEGVMSARLSGSGAWVLMGAEGGAPLARARVGEEWTVERRGDALRALGPGGGTSWRRGALVARATEPGGFLVYAGRRWRGELWLHTDAGHGVTVVNRVPAEDYLRGVVPLELAGEGPADHAALEAQAVAARSYTYSRLAEFLPREAAVTRAQAPFDVRATVTDQVYGGIVVESPVADRAILATTDLVLRYEGAVVSAPYYSACGGTTAAPDELWGAERAPYLRSVSDRVPGTDRAYCDLAPRFRWTRTWDGAELGAVLARYLRQYAARDAGSARDPSHPLGAVRGVDVLDHTASGRNGAVAVRTDAGRFVLRGNAIRFALRAPGGDILPSTAFSAAAESDGSGRVARLVLRGSGNGHGVGMCQWGAIGRSRAGQDFRAILRTYYPGTSVDAVE